MKASSILILTAALAVAGCTTAQSGQNMPGSNTPMGKMQGDRDHHMMMMQNMDANGDGKITKEEFMRFHEDMFDQMKNQEGVIDMKDMKSMHPQGCGGMMRHEQMQK